MACCHVLSCCRVIRNCRHCCIDASCPTFGNVLVWPKACVVACAESPFRHCDDDLNYRHRSHVCQLGKPDADHSRKFSSNSLDQLVDYCAQQSSFRSEPNDVLRGLGNLPRRLRRSVDDVELLDRQRGLIWTRQLWTVQAESRGRPDPVEHSIKSPRTSVRLVDLNLNRFNALRPDIFTIAADFLSNVIPYTAKSL
jgi:hypothetical protein